MDIIYNDPRIQDEPTDPDLTYQQSFSIWGNVGVTKGTNRLIGKVVLDITTSKSWFDCYPTRFHHAQINYGLGRPIHGSTYLDVYRTKAPELGSRYYIPNPTEEEAKEVLDFYWTTPIGKRYLRYYEEEFLQKVNKPYVYVSHVHWRMRRQGYATALYKEAAKWCMQQGLVLHQSRMLSPDSIALWEFFIDRGWATPIMDREHDFKILHF